jgi:CHRD domain-containing protein
MRKLVVASLLLVGAASTLVVAAIATGDSGSRNISAHGGLVGYNETPLTISTTGGGSFHAKIANDGESFSWTLSYEALEGSVLQSHIHFGAPATTGGISIFLCSNLGNGPAGTQACPDSGTISGTITPADVSPPIAATAGARTQGINTGEWDELMRAIDAGKTYANIHTTNEPGGEIRAQLNETGNPHD